MTYLKPLYYAALFACLLAQSAARIHQLTIKIDARRNIELNQFGFEQSGFLFVNVTKLVVDKHPNVVPSVDQPPIGVSLVRADEQEQFVRAAGTQMRCGLQSPAWRDSVALTIDWQAMRLNVQRKGLLSNLKVCKSLGRCISDDCPPSKEVKRVRRKAIPPLGNDTTEFHTTVYSAEDSIPTVQTVYESAYSVETNTKKFDGTVPAFNKAHSRTKSPDRDNSEVLLYDIPIRKTPDGFAFEFAVRVCRPVEAGLYAVSLHNCYKRVHSIADARHLSFEVGITEKNVASDSYLSAGDVPLPRLYFIFAALFLFSGAVWLGAVHSSSQNQVYRVHHLMTVLVFLKCTALFFHGVHFYYISRHGYGREVWAVIYYTMHFVKGALLFCVLILIGTGYTFYKNFLTDRDRKLFMAIIPLQVLANVALVILEETELGSATYEFWKNIFMLVDFACCVAVIAPVYWSIQHLKEASRTDGKAAFNVEKLKLFRHYYILVFCYIYVTRFIRFIIMLTVPFQYDWLVALAEELPTWLFYVFTGYKFRPTPNNPYLKLSQSDEEIEMDEAVTRSGVLEGVMRLKRNDLAGRKPEDRKQLLDGSGSSSDPDEDDVIFSSDITQAPVVPRSASGNKLGNRG